MASKLRLGTERERAIGTTRTPGKLCARLLIVRTDCVTGLRVCRVKRDKQGKFPRSHLERRTPKQNRNLEKKDLSAEEETRAGKPAGRQAGRQRTAAPPAQRGSGSSKRTGFGRTHSISIVPSFAFFEKSGTESIPHPRSAKPESRVERRRPRTQAHTHARTLAERKSGRKTTNRPAPPAAA